MIPTLGVAGKFKVTAPFSLITDKSYKCTAVSFILSLLDKDIDVFKEFYEPVGLTRDDYNADVAINETIVTLKTSDGDITNIPSAYLEEVPIDMEVPYERFGVMLEFGTLPTETSFTYLIEQLQELSKITTGIDPNASLLVLPFDGFVTREEHEQNLRDREISISYSKSPILALRDSQLEVQSLKQRIEALEEALIRAQ